MGNTAQFAAHALLELYSVRLSQKSRQGVSLTSIYLYTLTKKLTAQSAHLNYAVLPINQEVLLWRRLTGYFREYPRWIRL